MVVGAPRGLGLEADRAIGEIEVVVAEKAFAGWFAQFIGIAFGEGGEEALAGHGAVGDLNEAFGVGAEEGFGEGLFPDDFSGGGVEADDVDVLPEVAGRFAARGVFFEAGVAGLEEAEFSVGKGDGGIDDESAGVGPIAFPGGFGVPKNIIAEDIGGVGIAADLVIPGVAEVFFEFGAESNRRADDGIAFLSDVAPFMGVAMIGGEFQGGDAFSGGGVEDPEEVFDGDVEVVVIGTPIGTVVRDVDAAKVRDFHTPKDLAVVGIERHEAVEALVEKFSVGGEGGGHAGLSVDAEVGPGAADPLEFEFAGGLGSSETFAGVGGVRGGAVLVGPFAGSGDGVAGGEGSTGQGGAALRAGESGEFGRRAGEFFPLGADKVADAGGEGNLFEVGEMDEGDAGAVEFFGGEFSPDGIDEVEIVVEGGDVELTLGGEGAGEGAIGEADDDGEAGLVREILEIIVGERVGWGGGRCGHVVHAGVEFIDGAEFGAVFGFGANAVGVAGVRLELLEEEFVTKLFGGGFDDGAKLAGGAIGDDGLARVAGFPKEEGLSGSEETNRRTDGEGDARGFFGDGGKFFLGGQGVVDFDEIDAPGDGVEFVLVLVGPDDKGRGDFGKNDGPGHGARGCEGAIDIQAHLFAVISGEEVIPVAGFEGLGGGGFEKWSAGGEPEGEARAVVSEEPASFVAPVILTVTDDRAPFLRLVDADAGFKGEGFQGELLGIFFRKNDVLFGGKDEVPIGVEFGIFGCFARGFWALAFEFFFAEGPIGEEAGIRD